jgi:outer membrane immunogenic protein
MKAFLLATIGLAALAAPTQAADMPVKAPPLVAAPAVYNWTGFYIGGHIGGARSNVDWTFFSGTVSERFSQDASSWIGGGQVGFLWQWTGNWVIGAEVSYSATDLNETSTAVLLADRSRRSEIDNLLLVTGRLGYASDRWLTYVKGGYATARVKFDTFITSTGQPTTTSRDRENGWTVGAGFEYAITNYVSLGAEYNFVRLNIDDRNQQVFPGFAAPETVTDARADIHAVWARLNFRWWGAAPVVARY